MGLELCACCLVVDTSVVEPLGGAQREFNIGACRLGSSLPREDRDMAGDDVSTVRGKINVHRKKRRFPY